MNETLVGAFGIFVLLLLIFLRVPVALSMFLVGFGGISLLSGFSAATSLLATESFAVASKFELIVIPLFILMGNIATRSGVSRALYDAAYAFIGHMRGGLAMATLLGCGAFSALCGSSIAAALTMGKVSLGEMQRYRYHPRLSTATVAAGGTLGILIPPSTGLVIYALLTEQSIGRLFLAAFIPGLVLLLLYILTVAVIVRLNPEAGPAGEKVSNATRWKNLSAAVPGLSIILITILGLYTGFFSPVESAAVGAGLLGLWGLASRAMKAVDLWEAAKEAVVTSMTVMMILIAAHLINPFLALSHIPQLIGDGLLASGLGPWGVLALIVLCYIIMGAFMDGFAMLVLTLPIFFPVITSLGFDPIWFGVLVMVVLEIGLLSPPVGMNVFIVHSLVPHIRQTEIFKGVLPFWVAMMVAIVILSLAPQLATGLPNWVMG